MYKKEIDWGSAQASASSKGDHSDYRQNLAIAQNFCQKIKGSLMEGMSVQICDSHAVTSCLLTISWRPPTSAKIGSFASPLLLHQSKSSFEKELEAHFSYIHKMASDWENKNGEISSLNAPRIDDRRSSGMVTAKRQNSSFKSLKTANLEF